MADTLKQENRKPLAVILTGTVLGLAALEYGVDQVIGQVSTYKELGLAALASVLAYILANMLPADVKHRLVYVGYKHALPGHRCDTMCAADPRIDLKEAKSRWAELFSDEMQAVDRNAYWYTMIYASVRDRPEVAQSHGNFLLYRDAFSAIFIMFAISVVLYAVPAGDHIPEISFIIPSVLGIEAALFAFLARTWGNRMVTNAFAVAISSLT